MKTRLLFTGVAAALLLTGFTSCKKCEVKEENTSEGLITSVSKYEDAVIYVNGLADTDGYYLTGNSLTAQNGLIEVSFDRGVTKQDFPWGLYDIVMNPMNVNCEASFNRNVYLGLGDAIVYRVEATTCDDCENLRTVLNAVIIPKQPAGKYLVMEQEIIPAN